MNSQESMGLSRFDISAILLLFQSETAFGASFRAGQTRRWKGSC